MLVGIPQVERTSAPTACPHRAACSARSPPGRAAQTWPPSATSRCRLNHPVSKLVEPARTAAARRERRPASVAKITEGRAVVAAIAPARAGPARGPSTTWPQQVAALRPTPCRASGPSSAPAWRTAARERGRPATYGWVMSRRIVVAEADPPRRNSEPVDPAGIAGADHVGHPGASAALHSPSSSRAPSAPARARAVVERAQVTVSATPWQPEPNSCLWNGDELQQLVHDPRGARGGVRRARGRRRRRRAGRRRRGRRPGGGRGSSAAAPPARRSAAAP